MYYIEQVEGELVEASKKLWQAVKNNDMDTAVSIYTHYVGRPPIPATNDYVWWIYNAPSRVKRASKLTVDDYAKFSNSEEYKSYQQAARLAERRVGGKWNVFYEY